MAQDVRAAGGAILLGQEVVGIAVDGGKVRVRTPVSEQVFDRLIACAGLQSDVVARLLGADPSPKILPFRGEYWSLNPERNSLVNGMIYPVRTRDSRSSGALYPRCLRRLRGAERRSRAGTRGLRLVVGLGEAPGTHCGGPGLARWPRSTGAWAWTKSAARWSRPSTSAKPGASSLSSRCPTYGQDGNRCAGAGVGPGRFAAGRLCGGTGGPRDAAAERAFAGGHILHGHRRPPCGELPAVRPEPASVQLPRQPFAHLDAGGVQADDSTSRPCRWYFSVMASSAAMVEASQRCEACRSMTTAMPSGSRAYSNWV